MDDLGFEADKVKDWAPGRSRRRAPQAERPDHGLLAASRLVEFEGLMTGITGKIALWARAAPDRPRGAAARRRPPRAPARAARASARPSKSSRERAAHARPSRAAGGPASGGWALPPSAAAASLRRVSWEPELEELRRREELARRMGGEERVERQHASGRLTVRERIDRLLRRRAPSTRPARSPAAATLRRRRASSTDFLPANWSSARAGSTGGARSSRPTTSPSAAARPTRRSGRRWSRPSAWRTTCASRWCGSSTAPAAAAASRPSSRWASPTCRRSRGSSSSVENLSIVPGRGGGARARRRARRRPGRRLALLRDRARHRAALRRRPAGGGGGHGRVARQGGAGRRAHADARRAPSTTRRTTRTTRSPSCARFLSYLPDNVWEAPPVAAPTDPPDRREEELLSIVPRDPRTPYKMRRILEAVLDRGSLFELGAALRPLADHRAGAARRPPRRRARLATPSTTAAG